MRKKKTIYVYLEVKEFHGGKLLKWEGTIEKFIQFYEEILSKFG